MPQVGRTNLKACQQIQFICCWFFSFNKMWIQMCVCANWSRGASESCIYIYKNRAKRWALSAWNWTTPCFNYFQAAKSFSDKTHFCSQFKIEFFHMHIQPLSCVGTGEAFALSFCSLSLQGKLSILILIKPCFISYSCSAKEVKRMHKMSTMIQKLLQQKFELPSLKFQKSILKTC